MRHRTRKRSHSPPTAMKRQIGSYWYLFSSLIVLVSLHQVRSLQGLNGFYKIVGVSGTGTQNLPESYVRSSFQRWTASTPSSSSDGKIEPSVIEGSLVESVIRGTTASTASIQVRPTLDFVVQSGRPTYSMAGLQIILDENKVVVSQKIAYQWTTFDATVFPNFRVLLYAGQSDGTDERLSFAGETNVKEALEKLGRILSKPDTMTSFESGFHILSIPLLDSWTELDLSKTTPYFITCVATAEPDARELFTLDESLVEMTASSVLQIEVRPSDNSSVGEL